MDMPFIKIDRTGCTRIAVLLGRHVFKVPNFLSGWRLFLTGLLANMQERQFGSSELEGFCPVVFSVRGGWLVVMPRVQVMTDAEFMEFDAEAFCVREDYEIPAERKSNSFGFLKGRVVAIDYGS